MVHGLAGYTITGIVTADTEIAFEGTAADLKPGLVVAELEFDDDSGTLDEGGLYPPMP